LKTRPALRGTDPQSDPAAALPVSRRMVVLGPAAACLCASLPVTLGRPVIQGGWVLVADDL